MSTIALISINWNGVNDTLDCLGSIHKLYVNNLQILPIVVDNNSQDNSVEKISEN